MLIDEGLELLTEAACWELLRTADLGRIGVSVGAPPAVVAFEVDLQDRATRTGWSVLAIGVSEIVHGVALAGRAVSAGLEPIAGG